MPIISSSRLTPKQVKLEILADKFTALHKQEEFYTSEDYLGHIKDDLQEDGKKVVDEKCRSTMASWCYKILSFCESSDDTASIAMSHLDRFLSSNQGEFAIYDRRWFQLAVMCALFLSIKMNEAEKLDMNALLQLGRGCFTAEEVMLMEEEMIFALAWRLNPPTAHVFLSAYSELIPDSIPSSVKEALLILAQKQINATACNYSFSLIKPSEIALATLINAMHLNPSVEKEHRDEVLNSVNKYSIGNVSSASVKTVRQKLRKILSSKSDSSKSLGNISRTKVQTNEQVQEPASPVCVSQMIR